MDGRNAISFLRNRVIYITVLVLLVLFTLVIYSFAVGNMDTESAKVYLQALTGIATLALLYYAYFNVASRREEDVAQLELAVRPIFIWELQVDGNGAVLTYKTIKHPLYDFKAVLELSGKRMAVEEQHLDVSESNPNANRSEDVTHFIREALGSAKQSTLYILFAYHSEVGGRYEFHFTKEVVKKGKGFIFQHRKIISAKYPWRNKAVRFED